MMMRPRSIRMTVVVQRPPQKKLTHSLTSTGYFPAAVSPLSITQSAPSSTALPTSDTSARVGRGLRIMESSICRRGGVEFVLFW